MPQWIRPMERSRWSASRRDSNPPTKQASIDYIALQHGAHSRWYGATIAIRRAGAQITTHAA